MNVEVNLRISPQVYLELCDLKRSADMRYDSLSEEAWADLPLQGVQACQQVYLDFNSTLYWPSELISHFAYMEHQAGRIKESWRFMTAMQILQAFQRNLLEQADAADVDYVAYVSELVGESDELV